LNEKKLFFYKKLCYTLKKKKERKKMVNLYELIKEKTLPEEQSKSRSELERLLLDADENGIGKRIRKTSYIFTINNPRQEDFEELETLESYEDLRYMCFQGEKGEMGTHHLQGYMEFMRAIDITVIKKFMKRAHLEIRRGTRAQARHYCMKPCNDENCVSEHCKKATKEDIWLPFQEVGTWRENNKSTWWQKICTMIDEGKTDYEIFKAIPEAIAQHRAIDKYRKVSEEASTIETEIDPSRDWRRELKVYYIYGRTGIGKTYSVLSNFKNVYVANMYDKHPFDKYTGQNVLLIDEFTDKRHITYYLRLLDIYPVQLPCRYENTWLRATKIFVCSNTPFYDLYEEEEPALKKAFVRRFSHVIEMRNRTQWEVQTHKGQKTFFKFMEAIKSV
jgi:hypothetical protein